MSEHAWTLENLAAYVAGGLEPAERERLERHVAECADCSRALAGARRADRQFMTLFADVRPGPMFEDRLVRTLRKPREQARRRISPMWIKVPLAIAAIAVLAVLGAGITALIDNDKMPVFGSDGKARVDGEERSFFGSIGRTTNHGVNFGAEGKESERLATTYYKRTGPSYDTIGLGTGTMASYGRPYQHVEFYEKAQSADQLAADMKQWYGGDKRVAKHGKAEGFLTPDVDPALKGVGIDIQYMAERKADVSVPGGVRPDEAVGITNGDKKAPLTNLPAPGGFGNLGQGGALEKAGTPPSKGPGAGHTAASTTTRARSANGDVDHYFFMDVTNRLQVPPTPGQDKKEVDKFNESNKQSEEIKVRLRGLGKTDPVGEKKPPPPPEQPRASQRYIIRTGDIEFEVDSFDAAAAVVRKLVGATKGAVIATENSDRLVNGKVRGAIVVRMPPEHLDQFVLDLRKELGKTGELKGQKIGSEDVSKTYIDLESRLKAARTMEQRLLKIIKDGKGEIKDLVLAEKELGVWNTKIEEIEGELRYYQSRISLSTLTISLTEKEIRTAAAVRESERINAGVEVDDVEKAMREVLKAVEDAKGRVTRQEMKQHSGGQFSAVLVFDVAPDSAGPIRDRLNQLGTIARLEIDRVQTPEGGEKLPAGGRLDRGHTQFLVSLYNLANVTPQETVTLSVAAENVAEAYRAVRAAIVKAKGRIMGADLDQKSPHDIRANLTFAVPREAEATIRAALGEAGVVLTRSVNRVATPTGDGKDLAKLVTDKKVEYKLEVVSATAIEPRETVGMAIEVTDVEQTLDVLTANVKDLKGRIVKGPESAHEQNGRVTAFVVYEVPLSAEPALAEKLRNSGHVRVKKTVPNQQAPEGKLATARFIVTLANAEVLLPRDEGMMAYINRGLSYSLRGLSVSLSVLIVGVLFVLPWVLVLAAAWWLARRIWGRPAPARPAPAAPMPTPPAASA